MCIYIIDKLLFELNLPSIPPKDRMHLCTRTNYSVGCRRFPTGTIQMYYGDKKMSTLKNSNLTPTYAKRYNVYKSQKSAKCKVGQSIGNTVRRRVQLGSNQHLLNSTPKCKLCRRLETQSTSHVQGNFKKKLKKFSTKSDIKWLKLSNSNRLRCQKKI